MYHYSIGITQPTACKSRKNQRWPKQGRTTERHSHLVGQNHIDLLPLADLLLNGFVGMQERRLLLGLPSLPTVEGGRDVETHTGRWGASQPINQPTNQRPRQTDKDARRKPRERREREVRERGGRETREFREGWMCSGGRKQRRNADQQRYIWASVGWFPLFCISFVICTLPHVRGTSSALP